MKKANLTFFCLFIALMSIKAQSNFRPGYIITNEMDTISGLIDFRTYKMNAHSCKFKVSDISKEKVYSPGDIYGYRFTDDGKYYVTKDIEINRQLKKVFLEYLVQGVISLYFYPDDISDYYFFSNESGEMIPVTTQQEKKIVNNKTGKTYIMDDIQYKWTVNNIFKESKSVLKDVNKMSFNKNKMINITKKYDAEMCKPGEECIEFETKPDKYVKAKVSIYAGMQIQTYKMGKRVLMNDLDYLTNIDPDLLPVLNSFSPTFGAQLNLSVPRWNKSLGLLLDFSLAQFKDKQEREKEEYINQFLRKHFSQTTIDGWIGSCKLGGKYTFHNKGLFKPVIEGGFDANIMFASSYFYRTITNTASVHSSVFSNNSILYGFFLNAGVDYLLKNNNAIFFRVAYSSCYYPEFNDNLSSLQFNMGYTF